MVKDLKIKISIDKKTGALKVVNGEFDKMSGSIKKAGKNATEFSQRLINMAHVAVGLYAVSKAFDAIAASAKQFINTSATFEQFQSTLETIEGSSYKAKESMKWITDFTAKTPYNLDAVTESFVRLKSYGIEPTDGTLRTLGDTASAMGKPIMDAVEAVADAVTGENERLKSFGIRANATANQIKYSWSNASGEARSTIINNNASVIKSTLEAIFNSKYAGAMNKQSKTWHGLMSNLEDQWTIFQKNIMNGGLFEYLKAIVVVAGDYLKNAFSGSADAGKNMALTVIDGIKSSIVGLGTFYDQMTLVGDFFDVLKNIGATAFHGIEIIVYGVGDGITTFFEGVINTVVDGINSIIEYVNSTGFVSIGLVGHVDLGSDTMDSMFTQATKDAEQATKDVASSWNKYYSDVGKYNLGDSAGEKFSSDFSNKIDEAYKNLQNTTGNQTEKTDFGDAVNNAGKGIPTQKELQKTLKDYKVVNDTINNTVQEVTDSTQTLNNTLKDGNGSDNDTYTVVNNVVDNLEKMNDTTKKVTDSIGNATDAMSTFIFQFSDKFLSSIQNNINSLSQIAASSSNIQLSYGDALAFANKAKLDLISNPLDVTIGKKYTDAYNTLVSSADNYLSDKSKFASSSDYTFAQATVNNQMKSFQGVAADTVDVLGSMNNFLKSINDAFADGILTDAEKATIAGVADRVNSNNDVLLGSNGSVVVSTNTVKDTVSKLMGSGTSGISLARIENTLPSLSVSTGLDVSDLSNIKANTDATKSAVYNTSIKGSTARTLDNLRIKSVRMFYDGYIDDNADYKGGTNVLNGGQTTQYDYYAQGGFTGYGNGKRDFTGFKPAGIVHEDEWVAPKWMVDSNPALFGALEMARLGRTNMQSSYSSSSTSKTDKTSQYLFVLTDEMKKMNSLLRRVTDGGEAMKTEAIA